MGRIITATLTPMFAIETIVEAAKQCERIRNDPVFWGLFTPQDSSSVGDSHVALTAVLDDSMNENPDSYSYRWPECLELAALVGAPPAVVRGSYVRYQFALVSSIASALASHNDTSLRHRYQQTKSKLQKIRDQYLHMLEQDDAVESYRLIQQIFVEASSKQTEVFFHWEYQ